MLCQCIKSLNIFVSNTLNEVLNFMDFGREIAAADSINNTSKKKACLNERKVAVLSICINIYY